MPNLPPEEVRAHVLAEHTRLREASARLAQGALPTARKVGHAALRRLVAELRTVALEHAALEERELVPLLLEADAWGSVRVEQLRDRHHRVLRALEAFANELAEGKHGACDLVARIVEVIDPLFHDMEEEEATIDGQVRGSTVVVDQTDG